jgi:hypothetical protein
MAYFTYDTSVIIARKPLDLRAKSSRFLAGFSSRYECHKRHKKILRTSFVLFCGFKTLQVVLKSSSFNADSYVTRQLGALGQSLLSATA